MKRLYDSTSAWSDGLQLGGTYPGLASGSEVYVGNALAVVGDEMNAGTVAYVTACSDFSVKTSLNTGVKRAFEW